jgi:hypothetical protein
MSWSCGEVESGEESIAKLGRVERKGNGARACGIRRDLFKGLEYKADRGGKV